MAVRAQSVATPPDSHSDSVPTLNVGRVAVLRELGIILDSPHFRRSNRSKQFLSYVVLHKLDGQNDLLKERIIGTDLFQRAADYVTGDDPVVRVLAGEVRRRLEQYYHASSTTSQIRIEIPVGSYVPDFRLNPVEFPLEPKAAPTLQKGKLLRWAVLGLGLVLLAAVIGLGVQRAVRRDSALEQFWAPVFSTPQAVLICLSKPVLYRPSFELYRRYSNSHPGTFTTEVERLNQRLPLDPQEKIVWGDMVPFTDFGVASGDVYAASRLSSLFGRMNKPSQFRIGTEYSFDDLRNSPAVMVGAFSNWGTLEMTSNLRFVFVEKDERFWIQDRTSPDTTWSWRVGHHGEFTEDFGIVTRLLDSKTGQLLITVAGLSASGSDAAAQFISIPEYLAEGLRTAPPDWRRKNMEVVVRTTVIDSVAGPPHVVASYFW
jgi:hypothetical protein